MKNDSTPLKTPGLSHIRRSGSNDAKLAPRPSTIAILRQFARAYSCAASMPATIGGFVAN